MIYQDLPVYRNRDEILKALEENQVIVVESPTGSGKTTQIPLILLEAGYANDRMIGITQPRRIAAMSVCDFVNTQVGAGEGVHFCSCKMRFYDTTDSSTRIKIMTDGILLQELKHDPLLESYSVIMVDEAHERSLNIDFILGLLKNLVKQRPKLKVIISSATINTQVFSRFMDGAKIISIKSPVFPVQVRYMPSSSAQDIDEMIDTTVRLVNFKLKLFAKSGYENRDDILVFLPGEFEIKTCVKELALRCDAGRLLILPLYGRMNKEEQQKVFEPTPRGVIKVVVATNIAETSVTIDGIKTVIDSGLCKTNFYNNRNFTSALVTEKISRSSAMQRRGRAGRQSPGFCYRLYSEDDLKERPQYSAEEILRTDLSEVILRMSDLGIYDYEHFPFITRPSREAVRSAEQTLRFLGAIDDNRRLTPVGRLMVCFPLTPRHSRVIVEAMVNYPQVISEILVAVSFISTRTPFILPAGEEDAARAAHRHFNDEKGGDFCSMLEIFSNFTGQESLQKKTAFCERNYLDLQTMLEIEHVQDQLSQIVTDLGFVLSKGGSREEYLGCLAAGLKQFVCVKANANSYRSLTADSIYIHPGSAWFANMPRFILAGEIVSTSRMYARTVSPLSREILDLVSPTLYEELTSRSAKGAERETDPDSGEKPRGRAKKVVIYNQSLDAVETVTRKGKSELTVLIPIEKLSLLAKAQSRARRHPKNVKAALVLNGQFIHRGDSMFNIIDLSGKLPENLLPVDLRKQKSFHLDEFEQNADKLDLVGRLAILPKDRTSLGFVELLTSGKDSFFLNANRDYYDSLNNSSYSLMLLKQSFKGNKRLNTVYNRIMNIANRL